VRPRLIRPPSRLYGEMEADGRPGLAGIGRRIPGKLAGQVFGVDRWRIHGTASAAIEGAGGVSLEFDFEVDAGATRTVVEDAWRPENDSDEETEAPGLAEIGRRFGAGAPAFSTRLVYRARKLGGPPVPYERWLLEVEVRHLGLGRRYPEAGGHEHVVDVIVSASLDYRLVASGWSAPYQRIFNEWEPIYEYRRVEGSPGGFVLRQMEGGLITYDVPGPEAPDGTEAGHFWDLPMRGEADGGGGVEPPGDLVSGPTFNRDCPPETPEALAIWEGLAGRPWWPDGALGIFRLGMGWGCTEVNAGADVDAEHDQTPQQETVAELSVEVKIDPAGFRGEA
jgi:hypothetical protein